MHTYKPPTSDIKVPPLVQRPTHYSLCRNTWRRAITAEWLSTFTVADALRNLQSRFQVNRIKTSPPFLSQSISRTSLIAHRWVVTRRGGEDANRKWGASLLGYDQSLSAGRTTQSSFCSRTVTHAAEVFALSEPQHFFFLSGNNEMAVKLHPHWSM